MQGQTIVLGGSQLTVGSDVTVDGGAGVTIDANQASRVLLVQGLGTDVLLRHLTDHRRPNDGRYEGGGGIPADAFRARRSTTCRSAATAQWGGRQWRRDLRREALR